MKKTQKNTKKLKKSYLNISYSILHFQVGRAAHTEFDPKNGRDQFYSIKHGYTFDKRMGSNRSASQDIGELDPAFQTPWVSF